MTSRTVLKALFATVAAMAIIPVANASAGRLLTTGHDSDLHCSGGGSSQCHFVEVATNYVRGGAPDPTKPVLVLDNDAANSPGVYDMVRALDNAFGVGVVPTVVMKPQSAEFAAEPLTTSRYSAILVASDYSCGGCDLNPPDPADNTKDSDAINARKADIESFFNAGGGLFVNAGADHGNGDPSDGADVFYNFVPLPVGGVQVNPPFCLTPGGAALGFEDPSGCPDTSRRTGTRNDINCCATHNSFSEPDPSSAIKVSERDTGADNVVSADDNPETLFAEGFIVGGKLVSQLPSTAAGAAPAASCVRRPISLVRADVRGRNVVLTGLVAPQYVGHSIKILANYSTARTGRLNTLTAVKSGADGQFTATVRRPARTQFIHARYRAQVDQFRSQALKLPQALTSSSVKQTGAQIVVRGHVKRTLLGRGNPVVVKRLVCGRYRSVGSAKPDRKGNYAVRFSVPANVSAALFRAESLVLNKARGKGKHYVKQYARAISITLTNQTG